MTKSQKTKVEFLKYVILNDLYEHFFIEGFPTGSRNNLLTNWFSTTLAKVPRRRNNLSDTYKFLKERASLLPQEKNLEVNKLINDMKNWDEDARK